MSVPPYGGEPAPPSGSGDRGEVQAPVCYRHQDRETYVSCNRCGRPICPDCMTGASVGFQCPVCVAEGRGGKRQPHAPVGGRVRKGATVTFTLIALNVLVFLATVVSGSGGVTISFSGNGSALYDRFALLPSGRFFDPTVGHVVQGVAQGDYYRLLTSMFLHYGVLHILFNMYVLYAVGPALEQALGRVRFVAVYLLAGLGGSVASYAFGPVNELAAGASGAIFGLFGAYFIVARRLGADTGPIVATVALNLAITFLVPNIDIRAHLGGLVTGALLAAALVYAPRRVRRPGQLIGVLIVAAALLVITAVRTQQLA